MTGRRLLTALAILSLAACGRDDGPPVEVAEIRALAPLPGSAAGAAYLSVTNNGPDRITISSVRSPQFERIEMHETVIDDAGVSRMNRLTGVAVDAGATVHFSEGGKHLMLLGPRPDVRAGTQVSLEIEHSLGLLIVSATLQDRSPVE